MWSQFIFYGTAFLFVAGAISLLWTLRWVRRLPSLELPPKPDPFKASAETPIRCSIVVAARDEEARIEQSIRRLLKQQGVEIEIIVVDDRSTDQTGAILRRLAAEDSRLQVRRVDTLPEGWLGKCHACHVGASTARGEWILFTDADCWLKPDVISRALLLAERDGADHVTLTSGVASPTPGIRATHLMFLISIAGWLSGVNRDRPKSFVGIGAFNLVRADAYRQSGGYEALRLTVVDDVKLGLLLLRVGKRTRAFLGGGDAECYWGDSAWSIARLMEKNYFAALDYRLDRAIAVSVFVSVLGLILLAGLLSGTAAGIVAALSPLSLALPGGILARRLGWSRAWGAGVPFAIPVFLFALLNSTFVTLRRGGIRWRDTFYPLKALRAGNVQ